MKREELVIKVCGMREAANIRELSTLDINWLGLIFWPKSSRYVNERPDYLPRNVKRVGVFVDEAPEKIVSISRLYGLDYIQLHGHESVTDINRLRQAITYQGSSTIPPQLIKAFSIATASDLEQTKAYEGQVDYFLFDTRKPPREVGGWLPPGGTGEKFDWNILSNYNGQTPFLLSGGIGPEDAEHIQAFYHPQCIGIDLNSRFEVSPGLKDIRRLKTFLEQLIK